VWATGQLPPSSTVVLQQAAIILPLPKIPSGCGPDYLCCVFWWRQQMCA